MYDKPLNWNIYGREKPAAEVVAVASVWVLLQSVPVLAWHLMPRTILLSKVKAVAGKMATATQMKLVFGR